MSNFSAMEKEALNILAAKSVTNLSWLITTSVPMISNLLIVITIAVSKPLHNKSHWLMMSLSIAEILASYMLFQMGLRHYVQYYYSWPDITRADLCKLELMIYVNWFPGHYMLTLAIDRCLCIVAPMYYKKQSQRNYLLITNGIVIGYNVLVQGLMFLNNGLVEFIPYCESTRVYPGIEFQYTQYESIVVAATIAVIYVISIYVLRRKYKAANLINENEKKEFRRNFKTDVFKALAIIGFFNSFMLMGQRVSGEIIRNHPDWSKTSANGIVNVSVFNVGNSSSHLIFYLWFNNGFREAFLKMLRKIFKFNQGTPVNPVQTH